MNLHKVTDFSGKEINQLRSVDLELRSHLVQTKGEVRDGRDGGWGMGWPR